MLAGAGRLTLVALSAGLLLVVGATPVAARGMCSVTNPPRGDVSPTWSPEGRRIAFARTAVEGGRAFVTVLDLRRRATRRIAEGREPSWGRGAIVHTQPFGAPAPPRQEVPCPTPASPDARCVVHDSCTGLLTQEDLFVLGSASGRRGRVTETEISETSPALSPDGGRLAYVVFHPYGAYQRGIELLDLRTRERRRLTAPETWDADPAWSPDGREVLFTRLAGEQTDLFAVDVETRVERRITRTRAHESEPAPSADGRSLAFTRRAPDSSDPDVVVARADGSRARRVVAGSSPAWSPDGRRLAFVREGRRPTLALVGLRSGDVAQLTRR